MKVSDLLKLEAKCRDERGWKRGAFCAELGISQAKLRRHVDGTDPEAEIGDRTLALACAAVNAYLMPYGDA